jgi:ABC-2 type transport system permease protein
MHNTFLIARREYLERVRTKSFIIMTILLPVLMLSATILPGLLMMKGSKEAKHIVVVASDANTGELIRDQLTKPPAQQESEPEGLRKNAPQKATLAVDVSTDTSAAQRTSLIDKVNHKQLDGVLFATRDAIASKKITFITRDVSSFISNTEIERSVNQAVRRGTLKTKGLSDPEIEDVLQTVHLDTQTPTGTSNPIAVFITVFSMVMIMYVTVLLYGINVMRAILEEKTSRVMEVMLATARPRELMAGKIIGVGAVGLTQIAIWAVMALLGTSYSALSSGVSIKGILSLKLILFFGAFFLLGYALYSTLCAAIGSMVNSEQEAQQLQFIVMLPLIVAAVIMNGVIQSPNGSTAVWASLFPLTAPLIMFLRIALGPPPIWQIALSIFLMIATTYGLVLLCSRIYRVGILMYGKRPTLPEIMKWLRYA